MSDQPPRPAAVTDAELAKIRERVAELRAQHLHYSLCTMAILDIPRLCDALRALRTERDALAARVAVLEGAWPIIRYVAQYDVQADGDGFCDFCGYVIDENSDHNGDCLYVAASNLVYYEQTNAALVPLVKEATHDPA
jgi:hypothetical protein